MTRPHLFSTALVGTALAVLIPLAGGQDAKKEETKDDVPTLKKPKTKSDGVRIGGYLGYKEIQEKLMMTQDERVKIAEAQKWHREAEDKLYAEYESKIRTILGDERFRQLAKLLEEERKEAAEKKTKKKTESKTEPKPEEKK